ncbi:uncharacterized protein KY384_005523 [Bacidia gigantensis]|uniref:uncharacterized protein n=1 Tax=Bacidia gigantensis TaxID=2732470 RepID=UPI001D046864|nr:uncharacterized protein KY384_005523 [Bacidia gigantensis]KAG8530041.1 hypothetical protein KY384_005523 [Bacidia gigantensis]
MMARFNGEGIRTNESPMDWKYDNERGPVDPDSPWMQGARRMPPSSRAPTQKRSSSEMDSPQKLAFPQLREPEGQKFLFASIPTKKPDVNHYRNPPAFTTPQKPSIEPEETPERTPDQASPAYADSEATPDPPRGFSPLVRFEGNKSKKESIASSLWSKSGRGQISRKSNYTDGASRRAEKRRRRERDSDVRDAPRRYSNDSETEERPSSSEGGSKRRAQKVGLVPSILTFIDAHPSLPNTLSYYVQFLLNCVLALVLMYIIWGILSTIRHDINERAIVESSEILAEMAACAREFKDNRCERDTRVPAMESVCNGWEKCMARDPYKVGRSRLSAGMFAEIFNSFVEPISVKALVSRCLSASSECRLTTFQIVSITVIIGCFAVNNLTFGIYRSRNQPAQAPPPTPSQSAFLGHQPQQYLGFASPQYGHFQTPYQHQMASMPQSQQFEMAQGDSPTKRLGYR